MNFDRRTAVALIVLSIASFPALSKINWPRITPPSVKKAAANLSRAGQRVQLELMRSEQRFVDNAKRLPENAGKSAAALLPEMKAYCVEHASGAGGDRVTSIKESFHSRLGIEEVRLRASLEFGDGHVYWVKEEGCEAHRGDPL